MTAYSLHSSTGKGFFWETGGICCGIAQTVGDFFLHLYYSRSLVTFKITNINLFIVL